MDGLPPRFADQMASSLMANYFNVACLVVLALEYIQTVEREAHLIWPTKWTYVKAIFVLNRYLPLALVPPIVYYNVAPVLPALTCKLLFSVPARTLVYFNHYSSSNIATVGFTFSILVADALLYIRIYAVSGRSKAMRAILLINALIVVGLALAPFTFYLVKTVYIVSPFPDLAGCFGSEPGPVVLVMVSYGSLLYSAIVTASLFVFYRIRLNRTLQANPLLKVLYRDGTLYFLSIVAMSTINGLVAVLAPDRFRFLLAIPQGVLHNILATRMVLDIRETARSDMGFRSVSGTGKTQTISEFKAAKPPPRKSLTSSGELQTKESGSTLAPSVPTDPESVSGTGKTQTISEFKAAKPPPRKSLTSSGELQTKESGSTLAPSVPTDPESLDERTWRTKAQSSLRYPPS
ncbi:hypothetical protein FA15DRAFT_695374 [Coprinopsis marcescibilis]|uniref:DUF6533 domain-containing protein n=1 Tax=Coprinopsis marcescibilis TaxID=230819 RepID=A0A5C3KSZ8_COPMA|nr:hypothetical protein FA15DRAFT_695374 [Coprinopsis marcescibilis]